MFDNFNESILVCSRDVSVDFPYDLVQRYNIQFSFTTRIVASVVENKVVI